MTDLLSGLPLATPAAVRAARGDRSHAQAAELVGLGDRARWAEYERGVRTIDTARWALYLLATGQHPGAEIRPRRATPPLPTA